MLNFLTKLFKSKKDKDIQLLLPVVEAINAEFQKLRSVSDDELRQKSYALKDRIQHELGTFNQELDNLYLQTRELQQRREIVGLDVLFTQIDKLKKERNQALEQVLTGLLPEAFALVKETCRRLSENGSLRVTATDHDRLIASRKTYPIFEGDIAIWPNTWPVMGHDLTWDMVHYDVQLMGGTVLHQGKIAEMATGEGKTLVSTLPSYLNALAGLGVHIVTVNDYLARRDSQWNAPIFEFLGLTVDCIDNHEPNSDARRQAYWADITYGTNNEFGFDYLRDNMVTHPEHLVQREHHFAMIDEVDSVLIDEARTPLIISGPVPHGDRHEFNELKPRIVKLINEQSKIVNSCITKAKELLKSGNPKDKKEGGLLLLRAHRGLPKHKALIKFLSEEGIKAILQETENYYLQDKGKNMYIVDAELLFHIDEKDNQIELTEKGREAITASGEDPTLFVIPDIVMHFSMMEADPSLTPEARLKRKEELLREHAEKSERLHSINQLLKAYTLFDRDVDYIVQDGKVMIVDENTGRVLPGRRYSDGLHQALEAKENVKIEDATQTFATITLQNYFRMYHKLAGMTGTAETEAQELYQIYKLDVVVIPTNRPIQRKDMNDLVYKTKREKYNAIIERITQLVAAGRPVLVGTTSVETSELLSRALKLRSIPHNVLNAKQHHREAEIIAEAGRAGVVTIATNMAGRGTDIKLGPGVKEAGGLAIIGSERHEARRIDRQLRGRAGRQGDPGSSEFYVSLEDELMRLFASHRIAKVMDFVGAKEGEVITHSMVTKSIENAQRRVEENNFGIRKRLLEYDDVMNLQREAVYKRRRNVLFGDRIKSDIDQTLRNFCAAIINKHYSFAETEALRMDTIRIFGVDFMVTEQDFDKVPEAQLAEQLYTITAAHYRQKEDHLATELYQEIQELLHNLKLKPTQISSQPVLVNLTDGHRVFPIQLTVETILESQGYVLTHVLEKAVMLTVLDEHWMEHLRVMDDLKHSVQTAVYEQKDPLLIYKLEAYDLYNELVTKINTEILTTLFHIDIQSEPEALRQANQPKRDDFSKLKAAHDGFAVNNPEPALTAKNYVYEDGNESLEAVGQAPAPLNRAQRRELERKNQKKKHR